MSLKHPTVHGYAAMGKGEELRPFTYDPPKLDEKEVRVSVTHCGLCYSDVHGIEDRYGITAYPFVPGHEIVGHVSEVGPAVTGLRVGDRVGVGWQGRSCGHCEWCQSGEEQLCEAVKKNGVWDPYGGFSTSVKVDARFAYNLPKLMHSEDAAVLVCAGITVYSPLRSYAGKSPQKVGIVGIGGLGHIALQFAHALGYDVTAISSSPDKEEEATRLGADHFKVIGDRKGLEEANLDMLLCTAHANLDWRSLQAALRNNGRLVIVGFTPAPVGFGGVDLVVHQQSITGSFVGSPKTMREMLSFAQVEGIKPIVELMPMSKVNDAIRRLKENRARYRIVLVNEY